MPNNHLLKNEGAATSFGRRNGSQDRVGSVAEILTSGLTPSVPKWEVDKPGLSLLISQFSKGKLIKHPSTA